MPVDELSWIQRARQGDRRALGRLCRLLEEGASESLRRALYQERIPDGWLIGVTGSPGAGKSTLVSALATRLRTKHFRIGVVAVDPSSAVSGGALLGDRIRMQQHSADPEVFIRSAATRGALGGLARVTTDLARALQLWGARVVLIETVGVGQAESDVSLLADTTCVVVAPGQGDDIQASKAGLLELADLLVVNKADLPGAAQTVGDLRGMLAIGAATAAGAAAAGGGHATASAWGSGRAGVPASDASEAWSVPIVETCARSGAGVDELAACLLQHRDWLSGQQGGARRARRRHQLAIRRLELAVLDQLREQQAGLLDSLAQQLASGDRTPDDAAAELLERR